MNAMSHRKVVTRSPRAIPPHVQEEAKAKQHEQWQGYAQGYTDVLINRRVMARLYEEFVKELEPMLRPAPARVLDVASASGEPALSLATALPNATIIATDLAETYLPLGRARAAAANLTNVAFEAADGENLSQFEQGSFDAVTCCLGLMFFPDERKGLQEFFRVLKPGGTLAVAVWAEQDRVPFFKAQFDVASELVLVMPEGTTCPMVTASRLGDGTVLKDAMTGAGFVRVSARDLDVTFRIAGQSEDPYGWFEELLKLPTPLRPAIAAAEAAGHAGAKLQARSLLEASMREKGWLSGGGFAVPGNMCLFVVAQKPDVE